MRACFGKWPGVGAKNLFVRTNEQIMGRKLVRPRTFNIEKKVIFICSFCIGLVT